MGLPPYLRHCLAASLPFPILSYGSDIFHPMVHMVRKLAAFWHKVQRLGTNCFSGTPTDILAIDACLPRWIYSWPTGDAWPTSGCYAPPR